MFDHERRGETCRSRRKELACCEIQDIVTLRVAISDEPAPKEIEESRRQTDIGTIIRFDRFNLSFLIICGKGNISKQ